MIKCFKCDEEINYFTAYSEVSQTYEIGKDGEPSYYGCDQCEGFTSFNCPECSEELFTNEKLAIKFLKGKDYNE